ncbi:MAG: extracellular repeat protein family [Planctomycetota bacterium]|nr:extracellular repeat protein family [Planctomycetota bacterium]
MTRLPKTLRLGGFAGVLGLAMASPASADVLYTVKDEGTIGVGSVGFSNLFGEQFLAVNAAGVISPYPDYETSAYTGPLPSGSGRLVVVPPHASPDGQYQAGTVFASPSPAAWWAGFVAHNGVATPIGVLGTGDPYSAAFAVNNSGTVVGESGNHAISVDASGKMTDLGSLGGTLSAALGINSAGTIVGESQAAGDGFGLFRAFVSDGHGLTDLNNLIAPIPGFQLISASGINDAGQIAAYGRFPTELDGVYYRILLSPVALSVTPLLPTPGPFAPGPTPFPDPQPSPVPEPATVTLFGVIGGFAGWRAWRKRPQR